MSTTSKRACVAATLLVGSVLCLTATAVWACIGLSTLSAGSSTPLPGQPLDVRGEGYSSNGGQVSVHLDSSKGEVVAMVMPENDGTFHTTFTVPRIRGEHVLVAVQRDARGSITKTANLVIETPGPDRLGRPAPDDNINSIVPSVGPPGFALAGPLGLTAVVLLVGTLTRGLRLAGRRPLV